MSLASYSASESAKAADGSVGAKGLKPSMVARRFIAALRTSAALSPRRPMPRSATTSQCESGTAFFSAMSAQVCRTLARVNALTSCTRSTSRSRNPCLARSSGALASDVVLSWSLSRAPEETSEHTRCPRTVTSEDLSEYASPSRCGRRSEMFVIVVFGMRSASSEMKTPTHRTPTASESCWRLYSAGSTLPTSRSRDAARRAFSWRSAAAAAHSAIGPGRCSCLLRRCTRDVVTFSSWPHLSAHAPSMSNADALVTLLRSAVCDSIAAHANEVNMVRNASGGCLGLKRFQRSTSKTPDMTWRTRSRCSSHFHSANGAALDLDPFLPFALGSSAGGAAPALAASASAPLARW